MLLGRDHNAAKKPHGTNQHTDAVGAIGMDTVVSIPNERQARALTPRAKEDPEVARSIWPGLAFVHRMSVVSMGAPAPLLQGPFRARPFPTIPVGAGAPPSTYPARLARNARRTGRARGCSQSGSEAPWGPADIRGGPGGGWARSRCWKHPSGRPGGAASALWHIFRGAGRTVKGRAPWEPGPQSGAEADPATSAGGCSGCTRRRASPGWTWRSGRGCPS